MVSAVDPSGEAEGVFDEDEAMFKALYKRLVDFDYEVMNETIDDDSATVDVKISTYPFGAAMTEFISDYMTQALTLAFSDASEEKIEKLGETLFNEKINALSEKSFSETVTIKLNKTEEGWKVAEIPENSDFYNAITGNLIKSLENLEDIYSSDEE